MKHTFVIQKMSHPQQAGVFVWMMYASDGMLVGSVAGMGAKYGEDPNIAIARAFISDEAALTWLKKKCVERVGTGTATVPNVVFEERDGDSRIVPAAPGDMSRLRQ